MDITMLVIILGGLIFGAVILAAVVHCSLKKVDSIELVQGKLENSDLSISSAMSHLKLTNEWSKKNGNK